MRSGYLKVDYYHDRELLPYFFERLFLIITGGLIILLPFWASPYFLHLIILAGIAVIGTIGLSLLMGYTGQISLGHAAFLAIGAYATAILLKYFPAVPWPVILILSGLLAALIGVVAAIPAFRLKGLYLALSTLAFHQIVIFIILKAKGITNGAIGLHVPPPRLGGVSIDSSLSFYMMIMPLAVIGVILAKNLLRTKTGRAFVAIRDWDRAAEAVGVCLWRYKTLSFIISSFYAGVAGGLYAYYRGFVSPEDFTLTVSINYLGMVLIGGMGSLVGAVMGAIFLTFLPDLANFGSYYLGMLIPLLNSAAAQSYFERLVFGLVIVLFLIFEPDGFYGWWKNIKNYFVMWPFRY